jgi:hypothetical protein
LIIEKNGPGAAATAHRAESVASGKPTNRLSSKLADNASALLDRERPRIGRLSLRAAIDSMCRSCIYDPGNGNGGWRVQVAGCSSSNCPLHSVRPLPVKATNPASGRRTTPAAVIGAVGQEESDIAEKIGLNDQRPEERRAA